MSDRCKKIQEKLPDYLAGQIDEKEAIEISSHLKNCKDCNDELTFLNKSILSHSQEDKNISNVLHVTDQEINKLAKRTRKKFTSRIIKTVLITLAAMVIVYFGTITAIRAIKHDKNFYNGFSAGTVTSALIPYKAQVVNIHEKGLTSQYSVQCFGQFGLMEEKARSLQLTENVMTGKLDIPPTEYQDSLFMKTSISNSRSLKNSAEMVWQGSNFTTEPKDMGNEKKRLEVNKNNTIVLLDLVFKDEQDLDYIKSLYKKYDVFITWAALENKGASSKDSFIVNPKYIGFNLDISKDRDFSANVDTYKSELNNFIDRSQKFKNPLIDQINATYKNAVGKNLTNIKGIRVTGATSEIYSLVNDISPAKISIVKFDFWNWKSN